MLAFVIITAIFCFLYLILSRKNEYISFIFLVLALAFMAFNVVPNETDDLARYYNTLDSLRSGGWDLFVQMVKNNDSNWRSLPICGLYFYFCSLFPQNEFMPAITILITYGIMYFVLYKAAQKYNVSKSYLFISALFLLSTYWYYDTCSGVRNGLAFAIIIGCAYYQFVEKKNIFLCIIGYLIAFGLHSASVILISLIILTVIMSKNSAKFVNLFLIFGLLMGGAVISYIAEISDNEFIMLLADKAYRNVDREFDYHTYYAVNITVYIVTAVIVLYCSYYLKKLKDDKNLDAFLRFVSFLLFFMLGCIFSQLIFLRIARWVLPVISSIVFMIGMQLQKDELPLLEDVDYKRHISEAQRLRVSNKGVFTAFVCCYTAVHFWYLLYGSSLNMAHFEF